MIVSFDRIGLNLAIATPKGYDLDESVIALAKKGVEREGGTGERTHTNVPEDACKSADVVVTDTWQVLSPQFEVKFTYELLAYAFDQDIDGTRS